MLKYPTTFITNLKYKRLIHSTTCLSSTAIKLVSSAKSFEGEQRFYSHTSDILKCEMDFGVYLPPKAIKEKMDCPVLYFFNGLHATHENFIRKSGFGRFAAKFGICVVSPDTSPRNIIVPKHEVLGLGAGCYIDAIQKPWAKHFKMFSYVTKELIELVSKNLPVIKGKQSISGYSMGGYGALICSLKNPGLYQSVSAFAPICNPSVGGGTKIALVEYIGNDPEKWKMWDPCHVVASYSGKPIEIFIDQGTCDEYFKGEYLMPKNFVSAAAKNRLVKTIFKERQGYNHSHYFIATFIQEHMEFHEKFLNSK